MNKIIIAWHNRLDMPKYDLAWHKADVADELQELVEAKSFIDKWSELSDISYTYTRAKWSGHVDIDLPITYHQYLIGLIYMFPKYSLRWNFFYKLGKRLGAEVKVTEVRNPKKLSKLENIAEKYGLDKKQFVEEAKKLMRYRLFLK